MTFDEFPDGIFPEEDANDPFVPIFKDLYAKSTPEAVAKIHDAAVEIRSLLSDDEIIAIDWLRMLAAHVRQRGYEVQWDPKGKVAHDSRAIELLEGQRFNSAQVRERINRVLAAHGGGAGFGVALVARFEKQFRALYDGARATAPQSAHVAK